MDEYGTVDRNKRYKKRLKIRDGVHSGLFKQLTDKDITDPFYIDLVNDYMVLWDIKNELIFDIELKGISIKYQNGPEQWGHKKNDSVGELNRVNSQMLKILLNLNIKPEVIVPVKKEEVEFEL